MPRLGQTLLDHLPESELRRDLYEDRRQFFRKQDFLRHEPCPREGPAQIRLNLTGLCNLRCKFCEIHYFYAHAQRGGGKVHANFITPDQLAGWSPWLESALSLAFESGAGEPLLNPHAAEIFTFLQQRHPHLKLTITTNGVHLNARNREAMLRGSFHEIDCSLHAGNPQTYATLQGSNFEQVVENIRQLLAERRERRLSHPQVRLNFCLNRLNSDSLPGLLRLARDLQVDGVTLYHYYQSRNLLPSDISFYRAPQEGNRIIRAAYQQADEIGLTLYPRVPNLIEEAPSPSVATPCRAPWNVAQFPSCLSRADHHYFGVCNRINLLLADFRQWGQSFDFSDLWHHPYLQHLRRTVNRPERNPICRFCKAPETPRLRCTHPEIYARRRDAAVQEFLQEARAAAGAGPTPAGIEPLAANPFAYDPADGFRLEANDPAAPPPVTAE